MSTYITDNLGVPNCTPSQTPVILFCGGTSGEREISLDSGAGVKSALEAEGFPVTVIDPANKGFLTQFEAACEQGASVAFICLHGKGGEDGTVQGLCELVNLPYTGPGVLASALAMNKAMAKSCYRAHGLTTPESAVIKRGQDWSVEQLQNQFGQKCVVKPASEGSAIGVTLVHEKDELAPAIESALKVDEQVIVESMVTGTEITVAVLGNDEPIALPIIEIVPRNEFYDFDAKYTTGGAQHIIPARIPDGVTQDCKQMAIDAHKALGCKGVSRTDMIVDREGTAWILETNTIPGMTATSLLPDAAQQVGLSYRQLCHLLIDLALDAHRDASA